MTTDRKRPSANKRRSRARPARAPRAKSTPTAATSERVSKRIGGWVTKTPGKVFTPADFLDLGTPYSVGMTLTRMVRDGKLRRIARGLYDVPRSHPQLGELLPSAEDVAEALARRDGAVLQPAGAMAANLLNLSEQVPMKAVYLTDGRSQTVKVGRMTVQLKRRSPRQIRSAAPMSHLVFAALRSIGKENITPERIAQLRRTLAKADRARLLEDLRFAPAWMHRHIREVGDGLP